MCVNVFLPFVGALEMEFNSNIHDFAAEVDEVAVPTVSKYRPKSDFVPKWKRTKRMHFDISPVHEPLNAIKDDIVSKLGIVFSNMFSFSFFMTIYFVPRWKNTIPVILSIF